MADVEVTLDSPIDVEVQLSSAVEIAFDLAPAVSVDVDVQAVGPRGDAATIAVASTTTLSPGADATVSNSGDEHEAKLDFGVPQGDKGEASTVEVGETTTLNPGENATVSNSGDQYAAVLDFGIPQGARWYTGASTPSTTHNDGDLYLNTTTGDVYKQTNGSWGSPIANLTGPQGSAGSASGLDTQVQFNDNGVFAGDAGLTYNKTTNAMTVTGDITANNLSGENTGDQNLSGLVPKTTEVNGHALSSDVTISKSDVGLGNVDNTSDATKNAAAVALTNKTNVETQNLTVGSGEITGANAAQFTFPATSDTLVGRDTADTLTNKTIDGGNNTLQNIPSSALGDTGWQAASLQNGWIRFNSDYAPVSYRRIGKVVYLRGTAKGGTTNNGVTLFNLPSGFRHPYNLNLAAVSDGNYFNLRTYSSGAVLLANGNISSAWVCVDGISFTID
jgi:hypothetical protein